MTDSEALTERARACRMAGRLAEAAALFDSALAAHPDDAMLQLLAGETQYRLGLLLSARRNVGAAAQRRDDPDANLLLGRIALALGAPADAEQALNRVVERQPDNAPALRFLAIALAALGRGADSQQAFERADRAQPAQARTYNELGGGLLAERRAWEAETALRRALALDPLDMVARLNLALAFAQQDRIYAAAALAQQNVELAGGLPAAWNALAVMEGARGDLAAQRRALDRALALDPQQPDTLINVAHLRLEEGDAAASLALSDRALALVPDSRPAIDNLLLARHYVGADERDGGRAVAARLRAPAALPPAGPRNRDPARRLRIGYVSPDFRRHSCASFLRPLFAAHDAAQVEILAYSDVTQEDEITRELRASVATWRAVAHLGDAALAEIIRADGVDILIDLTGHMAGNRLPVFMMKPAPVQASWLGYPGPVGVDEIDWRMTDAQVDPAGVEATTPAERPWRMEPCFLLYGPAHDAPATRPRDPNATPVFGSFNHLPKVTPEVVAAWSRILVATPGAKLVMKAKRLGEEETRARYLDLFAAHGVAAERLELLGWRDSPREHLALYDRIDVALDPFPYNGATTTCEALWMGAPVVTLAGERPAGRVGVSLLAAVGLTDLVANSVDDYVARATALARDSARRAALRAGLRADMAASPLTDARAFARRFEEALRGMWRAWIAGAGE